MWKKLWSKGKRNARKTRREKNRKPYGKPSLAFSGTIIGAMLGGLGAIIYGAHVSYVSFLVGALVGCVLTLGLGFVVASASERTRMQVQYGICGLFPGFMIVGNPYVWSSKWGSAVGAIGFGLLFAFVLAPLLHRMKRKGRYVAFPGEGGVFALMGLIMSYVGDEIAKQLIRTPLFYISKQQVSVQQHRFVTVLIAKKGAWLAFFKGVLGFSVPFLLVLITFLWIGFVLAANRRRPAFGVALTSIGGIIIAYIGFKVAPLLFGPHSGLLWAGVVVGLLMIAMAITAFYYTQMRVPLGVVIIVLSILSFVGAAGGLLIGGVLGIFGGAMITSWRDETTVAPPHEEPPALPPGAPMIL